MRTAITVVKNHKGEWRLLATPDDPLIEQRQAFRQLRADKSHKEYAQAIYQESDGACETLRFITEKEKAERAKSHADAIAQAELDQELIAKAGDKSEERKKAEAEFAKATEQALAEEKKNPTKK